MSNPLTTLVMMAGFALTLGCSNGGGTVPFVPIGQGGTDEVSDQSDAPGLVDGAGQDDGGDVGSGADGVGDTGADAAIDGVDPDVEQCGNGSCEAESGETTFNCPVDCPADTGPGTCANLCGAYNVLWECQCETDCKTFGDCCDDYELNCPQGSCGDGQCGHDENVATCAQDCAGPYQDAFEPCLEQLCPTQWAACSDYPDCESTWKCMINCGPELKCVQLCQSEADAMAIQRLNSALECGKDKGCFSESGAIDVVCGNGICEIGEFASTCPADCKQPSALSCKSRCGDFSQNAPCQCDASCSKLDECCNDFESLCM